MPPSRPQGRNALIALLAADSEDPEKQDALITNVYTWAVSLRDYAGR